MAPELLHQTLTKQKPKLLREVVVAVTVEAVVEVLLSSFKSFKASSQ